MNDPYAMPNGVLHNKLGITDHQLLAAAEADITRARLVMLAERPLPGAYDLGHLQAFHAAIFGDIYPWAGELRTVNIAKRTPFCRRETWCPTPERSSADSPPPVSCGISPGRNSSSNWPRCTAT
ncbi:Fic/DOC family protein [Streptomyces europaeiscabiei]|uniref:Fic/DOC family protein n=1 Tax=Streptomyces europaeiscabiei TaxID=146819 RepID=UPI0029BFF306|nr:hypothetical protein [Streptomyces europaeiscabiei]